MVAYGPWTQPEDRSINANAVAIALYTFAPDGAAALAGAGNAGTVGPGGHDEGGWGWYYPFRPAIQHFHSPAWGASAYWLTNVVMAVDAGHEQLDPYVPYDDPQLDDPRVIDVDYEADHGKLISVRLEGPQQFTHDPGPTFTVEYRHLPNDALPIVGERPNRMPEGRWLLPADFAAAPFATVYAYPDYDTPTTQPFPITAVYPAYEFPGLLPIIPAADIADELLLVAVISTRSRTGDTLPVPPSGFAYEEDGLTSPSYFAADLLYTPPRYRMVFAEALPQRQFPRDDGLAASTRRTWPPRSSRQRGSRRGPDGTYL